MLHLATFKTLGVLKIAMSGQFKTVTILLKTILSDPLKQFMGKTKQ